MEYNGGEKMSVELPENKILLGNVLDVLKTLPSNSVDCMVTSPPYSITLFE